MSEITETETTIAPPAPAKRKVKKAKRKVAAPKAEQPKSVTGEFAGITAKDCPHACTVDKCCISTVGICAHPYKSAVNGFGPITMANRDRARKLIKHQMVDMKG
jgi:hypothetical protein